MREVLRVPDDETRPPYARPSDPAWVQDLAAKARTQDQLRVILLLLSILVTISLGLSGWVLLTLVSQGQRLQELQTAQSFVSIQTTQETKRLAAEVAREAKRLAAEVAREAARLGADVARDIQRLEASVRDLEGASPLIKLGVHDERLQRLREAVGALETRVQQLERARLPAAGPPP